jgi:type IV secretion system protein VirB6
MAANIFTFIGDEMERVTEPFLHNAVPSVIAAITPVAIAGVALYFAVMGYMVLSGAVQEPFWNFLKQGVKILLVAACALHADTYLNYVVESFRGLESGLMSAVSGEGSTAYQVLDQALDKGLDLVFVCFQHVDKAGVYNLGSSINWFVAGLCVALGSLVITLLAGVNIIVAKVALVIVFAVGPLFIMSLMWPVTARFFDSWFGQVLNYTFTAVISAVVMSFGLAAFQRFLQNANFDDSAFNPVVASLQILGLGLVLGFLMLQATSMASSLAGGMGLSSVGISFLTAPFRGAGAVAKGMTVKSAKLDPKSGRMVEAGALGHLAAGRSVLNPRYRQALLGSVKAGFGNWGRADGGSAKEAKR